MKQGFLEEWLISGLGQRKHNISLEHLVMPELRENSKNIGDMSKGKQKPGQRGSH